MISVIHAVSDASITTKGLLLSIFLSQKSNSLIFYENLFSPFRESK